MLREIRSKKSGGKPIQYDALTAYEDALADYANALENCRQAIGLSTPAHADFNAAKNTYSQGGNTDDYKTAQDDYRLALDSLGLPENFDFNELDAAQTDFDAKQTDLDAKQIVKLNNFASPALIHILERGKVLGFDSSPMNTAQSELAVAKADFGAR
ncbi:MAG: hypothetical protein GY862_29730 [Gammaproteobacteria bacterium]|nr:hypothetical protein [Gammaproteobacteria bacterium]